MLGDIFHRVAAQLCLLLLEYVSYVEPMLQQCLLFLKLTLRSLTVLKKILTVHFVLIAVQISFRRGFLFQSIFALGISNLFRPLQLFKIRLWLRDMQVFLRDLRHLSHACLRFASLRRQCLRAAIFLCISLNHCVLTADECCNALLAAHSVNICCNGFLITNRRDDGRRSCFQFLQGFTR